MATKTSNIYQFKITLKSIKPKIWRRIQVPANYNFKDLHLAIQNAMGWANYHLHKFEMQDPKTGFKVEIGMPDNYGFGDNETIPEGKAKIAKYFLSPKDKASYEYDFGDGWEHDIVLEKILPSVTGNKYPQCIAGERACPPEDCGGVWGYENLLEIISDPNHEEYEERMEWLGNDFSPEDFDPKSVEFKDCRELKQI